MLPQVNPVLGSTALEPFSCAERCWVDFDRAVYHPVAVLRFTWLPLALFALACGPLGPMPGGRLSGEVADPPSDWSFTDAQKNVQLETRPSDPYSVNIWGAAVGDRFYVASGKGGETAWAANIEQDPDVRLRVGKTLYELRAVRVDDDAGERGRFLAALKRKYDYSPDAEDSSQAWLYRLEPR